LNKQTLRKQLKMQNMWLISLSFLLTPFGKFVEMKIFFSDFSSCHDFSIVISFVQSQILNFSRIFFLYFANRAVILNVFDWKRNRKAFRG